MSLRIGVDAGLFPPRDLGGLASHRAQLLEALVALPGDHAWVVYGRRPPAPARGTVVVRDVGDRISSRVPGAYRQWLLPRLAAADRVDVMLYPLGSGSLGARLPGVVWAHDMLCRLASTLDYPVAPRGFVFRARKVYHRFVIPASLRRARLVLASSRATRDDVVRLAGVASERVRVVPLAAAPRFRERVEPQVRERVLAARGLAPGYVLAFATVDPRKNTHRVVEAFARLSAELRRRHPLVVVLTLALHRRSVEEVARRAGVADAVRFLPHQPAHDLPAIYAGAAALAFASLHEGFGLPALEAMEVGVPVVCSAAGGLREVVADAAEIVEPTDVAAIAAGLERVLGDPGRARAMVERGRRRARAFDWERTAARTLDALREAAR